MARKRKLNNPYDFAFGVMYNEYPKEFHEELNIPGIFKRKSNVKVRLKDGRMLEMDASYVVDPDFKVLFEPAVVDLEHQSTPVDMPKIKIIGDYNIQQIADERLPPLNVIASHLNEEKSIREFERTPTSTTKLMFLNLGRQDNKKRLNTVSNIIKNHEEHLTIGNALNLGIIVLFAPRDSACEITRQIVELYNKIKNKPKKLEYTLYSVICTMIDAYFDDDEEFKELIDMINNETGEDVVGRFETEIISQNKLIELGEKLDVMSAEKDAADAENVRLKAEKDALDNRITQLQDTIKELENQLRLK
ncbi:hypothetical protein [Methanobrevibacter sp.]|jgi:hypothetical protein|uniref:hypothetical protein n=1 Tax=Methanobrevibacter sp. TaxID=66852 RepID=UPI00386AE39E